MKVILTKDFESLGKAGTMTEVKDGYARNFLIPQQIAVEATKENEQNWKEAMAKREEQEKYEKDQALKTKEAIENLDLKIQATAGEQGKLFGSITNQEIADALQKQASIYIDKKKIELAEPIKSTGETVVTVRVYPEITAELKINVEGK